MDRKPLKKKIYGSIPHLPDSRLGPSDKQANPGHVRIATKLRRDRHDLVIVSEKLDGSNVGVAKLWDGSLVPLTRSGYEATSSPYRQHQYWAVWVWEQSERFDSLLTPGEWCVGEWCIQAHSTRYVFEKEPFFLFDIFRKEKRIIYSELCVRNEAVSVPFEVPRAYSLADGGPVSLELALKWLGEEPYGVHGAVDLIEGFVWRIERKGEVDFLTKYVRPDKVDGLYLPETSVSVNDRPIYNYWMDESECIKHLKNEELLNERPRRPGIQDSLGYAGGKKCIRRR
jgi:hypothetical protein